MRHCRNGAENPWRDRQNLILFETRSFPKLPRRYPRDFTFYVADPISSILQITFCAEQWKCSSFDFRNSKLFQIIKRRIDRTLASASDRAVARRNKHDHALSRAREQNAIRIAQINSIVSVRDVAPSIAAEIVVIPVRSH